MIKTALLLAAGTFVSTLPLAAQNTSPLSKPLSESQLLSTLDSLGTGDPAKKAPLSVGNTTAASGEEGKKADDKKPQGTKGPTEITSQEARFDQKTHNAVFGGNVVVKNPEFTITCDKLTAFLRNENGKSNTASQPEAGSNGAAKATTASTAPAAATPKPAAGKGAGPDTGALEKAIAEALSDRPVVITQNKIDADGKVKKSIGRARRAVYDANTGDVVLTGRPSLQRETNTIVATEDGTVMTLNKQGDLVVTGQSKVVLEEAPDSSTPRNGR